MPGGCVYPHAFGTARKRYQVDRTRQSTSLAYLWNWGSDQPEHNPQAFHHFFRSQNGRNKGNLIVDHSLIGDLESTLYTDHRFLGGLPEANTSCLFKKLQSFGEHFASAMILRLDERGLYLQGRPIAHVFADVIDIVRFLREKMGIDDDQTSNSILTRLVVQRRKAFWKRVFSKYAPSDVH